MLHHSQHDVSWLMISRQVRTGWRIDLKFNQFLFSTTTADNEITSWIVEVTVRQNRKLNNEVGTVLVSRISRLRSSRSSARALPSLNLNKKRDCSRSTGREKRRACKTPQSAHYLDTSMKLFVLLKWYQNVLCGKISQARHVCLTMRMCTCWLKPSKLTNHRVYQEPINRITDILETYYRRRQCIKLADLSTFICAQQSRLLISTAW